MSPALGTLRRWWRLWNTLPKGERDVELQRVLDRLARRDPRLRSLPLVPERFERALRIPLADLPAALRAPDPRRGPLHANLDARAAAIAAAHPAHADRVIDQSAALARGTFDLLGSGPADLARPEGGLDWHVDWVSGKRWDERTYFLDVTTVRGDGSDVKLPWELSRCQHLLVLGQAWQLAPHRMPAAEAEHVRRRAASAAAAHLADWIARNPPGIGVNWACTMDVALRAFAWCAALGLFRGAAEFDDALLRTVARSLWQHGRFIRRQLEIGADGLTSNHYLSDIVGLAAIAALLPELREAPLWRAFAAGELEREIVRQVHPDGADFERSLPYHRLVAELFLHGALLAGRVPRERLEKMLEFTRGAMRPDGTVPQWGDNDDGRALPLAGYASHDPQDHRELLALGGTLLGRGDMVGAAMSHDVSARWLFDGAVAPGPDEVRSRLFEDVGFAVLRNHEFHVTLSTGRVGTRGLGNHTHNDLLSITAWAAGREWITDPGTGTYTRDPALRQRLRSTAAHATLQVGTREQHELPPGLDGLFRVVERARCRITNWEPGARVIAEHDGFSVDGQRVVHERELHIDGGTLTIVDRLRMDPGTTFELDCRLRFPLAPGLDARVESASGNRAIAHVTDGTRTLRLAVDAPQGARVAIEDAPYSPRYGVVVTGRVIVVTADARDGATFRTTLDVAP